MTDFFLKNIFPDGETNDGIQWNTVSVIDFNFIKV